MTRTELVRVLLADFDPGDFGEVDRWSEQVGADRVGQASGACGS